MSAQGEVRAGSTGKSWVVRKANGKWQLVHSYWSPGYTPAHAEDQGTAKQMALLQLNAQLKQIQDSIAEVQAIQFICISGCDDALPPDGPGVDPDCPVHGWT